MKTRRLIARILLPFLVIWSVAIPRQAYSFGPLTPFLGVMVGVGVSMFMAAGAMQAMSTDYSLPDPAAAVGKSVMQVEVARPPGTGADGKGVAAPDNAASPGKGGVRVPGKDGDVIPAPPSPPDVLPTMQFSTAANNCSGASVGTVTSSDGTVVCEAFANSVANAQNLNRGGDCSGRMASYSGSSFNAATNICTATVSFLGGGLVDYTQTFTPQSSCPPGTTLTGGGVCSTSDSRKIPSKDNTNADYARNGASFSPATSGSAATTPADSSTVGAAVSAAGSGSSSAVLAATNAATAIQQAGGSQSATYAAAQVAKISFDSGMSQADAEAAGINAGKAAMPPQSEIISKNGANDTVRTSGASPNGEPRTVDITARPDGGTDISVATQKADSAGNTYISNTTYNINNAGTVTSAATTATTGSLAGTGSSGNGAGTSLAPSNGTGILPSMGGGGTGTINFPSDYSREATQGQIKQALTQTGDLPAVPAAPSEGEWIGFGTIFDSVKSQSFSTGGGQCPQPGFDWNGTNHKFTAHCDLWSQHSAALSSVMTMVWAILALFIVLGA